MRRSSSKRCRASGLLCTQAVYMTLIASGGSALWRVIERDIYTSFTHRVAMTRRSASLSRPQRVRVSRPNEADGGCVIPRKSIGQTSAIFSTNHHHHDQSFAMLRYFSFSICDNRRSTSFFSVKFLVLLKVSNSASNDERA
ncbi:hypothetical protein ARMSODRAFT_131904 [Armillaria solidipes]|uniref:Uncharacterized protein n=1 Tax=Armillaria solidipes TaxID=1076256 RepID=A0A2H3BKR8_9AGAR|nr:hypothetical protein ARMSODRAFT_131904 [Armillaria solidipes]